jgi:hypothetical protein
VETPIDRDKCLEILMLRRADCTQDDAARIVHCAKSKISEVENWFENELSYSAAVEFCNEAAINEIKNIDIRPSEEVDKVLLEKILGITPDTILRHYRRDYVLPLKGYDDIDLAVQFQSEMANISPKDIAIWGLSDSEAGLKTRIERSKLVVRLSVEQDNRFQILLNKLMTNFLEFQSYTEWRNSLNELIVMCWDLAHEIISSAKKDTGLIWSSIPVMGQGHLIDLPQFIYEFALDNYNSGKQPDLIIGQIEGYNHGITPVENPSYILARGSMDKMLKCQKVTFNLISKLDQDERVNRINDSFAELEKQSLKFRTMLSKVIKTGAV